MCVAVENTCDRGGRKESHNRAEKCSWVVGGAYSSAGNVANFVGGFELTDEKFENAGVVGVGVVEVVEDVRSVVEVCVDAYDFEALLRVDGICTVAS